MKYTDYSHMLAITDNMTDEQLDKTVKEYKDALKLAHKRNEQTISDLHFFKRNVKGLEHMQKERERINIAKSFKMTDTHYRILENCDVQSDTFGVIVRMPDDDTMCEILDIKHFDKEGSYLPEDADRVKKYEQELLHAVRAALKTK